MTKRVHTTQSGFTLAELLVVVVIAGILAVIASPSFQSITQSQRAKSASFDLLSSLNLARSEAIKRNADVTITPVSGNWQDGWDISASGVPAIRTQHAIKGIVITGGPASVVYAKTGRAAAASFQIDVSATATANARCIKIDLSGMPRSIKGACP